MARSSLFFYVFMCQYCQMSALTRMGRGVISLSSLRWFQVICDVRLVSHTRCDTGNGDEPDTNRDVNVDFYRYKDTRLAVNRDKPYDTAWCNQGDEGFSNRDVNVDSKRYTNALWQYQSVLGSIHVLTMSHVSLGINSPHALSNSIKMTFIWKYKRLF